MIRITIYTKPNCPLCDEALDEIRLARQEVAFECEEFNILEDLSLYERYKHNIPVILLNGREIYRYRLSSVDLVRKLQTQGTSTDSF